MQCAKLRGQTLLCNMLAKFLKTSTEHTDPLSSTKIWRFAHLHRRVFMVRSCSCGQFNSSDPKAPDVRLEIISSDLKNIRGCYHVPLAVLSHTLSPQIWKDQHYRDGSNSFSFLSPQVLLPSRRCFRSHSLVKIMAVHCTTRTALP